MNLREKFGLMCMLVVILVCVAHILYQEEAARNVIYVLFIVCSLIFLFGGDQ